MAFTTPLNSGKVAGNGGTTRVLPSFNATAGSTVVVYVADTNGNSVTVADNKGATYTQRAAIAGTSAKLWVFTTTNHPGGAGCVITVTFGSSADSACSYQEWPASTVDTGSLVTATTGTSPFSTSTNALAAANSVVLLAGGCDQGGTVNYSETTGFTKNQEETNGSNYWTLATFFKVVSSTAAVGSSLGMNNGNPAGNGNRVIFALNESGGPTSATITPAAGAATSSTITGASKAASAATSATGAATASTMVGRSSAAGTPGTAAGTATTGTLTGAGIVAASITPAAGTSTTAAAGAARAAAALTPAAGQATTSTTQGASTAASSISPAAGVASASTLVGSSAAAGQASIIPAAGSASTSALAGSSTVAASIVPASGSATTATLASNGAPARGMELDYEAGPGPNKPRRAKFVSVKPVLQAALESRLPEPEPEELEPLPAANALSAGIQAPQTPQLTPAKVELLDEKWRVTAARAPIPPRQDAQLQYQRAVQAQKQAKEAQDARAAQLAEMQRRAKARADDEEAIARAVALLF